MAIALQKGAQDGFQCNLNSVYVTHFSSDDITLGFIEINSTGGVSLLKGKICQQQVLIDAIGIFCNCDPWLFRACTGWD